MGTRQVRSAQSLHAGMSPDDLTQYLSDRIDIVSAMFGRKKINIEKAESAINDINEFYYFLVNIGNFEMLRKCSRYPFGIISMSNWPGNKPRDDLYKKFLNICLDNLPIGIEALDGIITDSEKTNIKAIHKAFLNLSPSDWFSVECASLYLKHLIEIKHFSASMLFAEKLITSRHDAVSAVSSATDMICNSDDPEIHDFVFGSILNLIKGKQVSPKENIHEHMPYVVIKRAYDLGRKSDAVNLFQLFKISSFGVSDFFELVHNYGLGEASGYDVQYFIRDIISSLDSKSMNGASKAELGKANKKAAVECLTMIDACCELVLAHESSYQRIPLEIISLMVAENESRSEIGEIYQNAVTSLVQLIDNKVKSLRSTGKSNICNQMEKAGLPQSYLRRIPLYKKIQAEESFDL